jgi:ubiquitin-protein ligase E3 C
MSPESKEKFLLFVTGSDRPPLLGFKHMNPKCCIHSTHIGNNERRLPTAATCMNMLRLPHYGGRYDIMQETLEQAINSGAGFNLE